MGTSNTVYRLSERGAASLIVVIFSILLLVTVSVGFMRLVLRDQERTLNDELARGAYDAAVAGIEDGKRVLQSCINNGNMVACAAISNDACNTVSAAQVLSTNVTTEETLLQNSFGTTGGFDQAYTCVKIKRNTIDYQGSLRADTSAVIPLKSTMPFNEIIVSWHIRLDTSIPAALSTPIGQPPLPTASNWPTTSPSLLRAQLMQYRIGGSLGDFDMDGGGHTLYLYPATVGATETTPLNFGNDIRYQASGDGLIKPVACNTSPLAASYICSVRITLPDPPSGNDANRNAYLRLTSVYGATDFRVRFFNAAEFQDVQPAIDSTGRASNVFRRVRARVEQVSSLDLYPRATVDITKNFCKDFGVSSSAYYQSSSCDANDP